MKDLDHLLEEGLGFAGIPQDALKDASLMIRQGAIPFSFTKEAGSAGRDNGQRSCEVMDEKIEQTLFRFHIFTASGPLF